MKKIAFSFLLVLVFSHTLFSDENVFHCKKNITIDSLDRKNSDELVCYMLQAKKDFNTLLKEQVLCPGIGFEEYSKMMNYLPIFHLSFIRKKDVGYGYSYRFNIDAINTTNLKYYKNTSTKIENGKLIYKSNGLNLNFELNSNTTIGTAYLPNNKEQMCIWLD